MNISSTILFFLLTIVFVNLVIYFYVRSSIIVGTILKDKESGDIVRVIGIIDYDDRRCYRLSNGEVYDDIDLIRRYVIVKR